MLLCTVIAMVTKPEETALVVGSVTTIAEAVIASKASMERDASTIPRCSKNLLCTYWEARWRRTDGRTD